GSPGRRAASASSTAAGCRSRRSLGGPWAGSVSAGSRTRAVRGGRVRAYRAGRPPSARPDRAGRSDRSELGTDPPAGCRSARLRSFDVLLGSAVRRLDLDVVAERTDAPGPLVGATGQQVFGQAKRRTQLAAVARLERSRALIDLEPNRPGVSFAQLRC